MYLIVSYLNRTARDNAEEEYGGYAITDNSVWYCMRYVLARIWNCPE